MHIHLYPMIFKFEGSTVYTPKWPEGQSLGAGSQSAPTPHSAALLLTCYKHSWRAAAQGSPDSHFLH